MWDVLFGNVLMHASRSTACSAGCGVQGSCTRTLRAITSSSTERQSAHTLHLIDFDHVGFLLLNGKNGVGLEMRGALECNVLQTPPHIGNM